MAPQKLANTKGGWILEPIIVEISLKLPPIILKTRATLPSSYKLMKFGCFSSSFAFVVCSRNYSLKWCGVLWLKSLRSVASFHSIYKQQATTDKP